MHLVRVSEKLGQHSTLKVHLFSTIVFVLFFYYGGKKTGEQDVENGIRIGLVEEEWMEVKLHLLATTQYI